MCSLQLREPLLVLQTSGRAEAAGLYVCGGGEGGAGQEVLRLATALRQPSASP